MALLCSQEREDGEDAAVVVWGGVQVQASEDAVHVGLHRLGLLVVALVGGVVVGAVAWPDDRAGPRERTRRRLVCDPAP